MSEAFKCDHCNQFFDGSPSGAVVHRDGVKDVCRSTECFLALANHPNSCSLGTLSDIERKAEREAEEVNLDSKN